MFNILNTFGTIVKSSIELYTSFSQFYNSYVEDKYWKTL